MADALLTPASAGLDVTRRPLLEVADLTVNFRTDDGAVQAVRGVDFSVEPGRVLAIVGESGSGKSVTAMSILKLLPPSATVEGTISWQGEDLLAARPARMREIRGSEIAMIFQDPLTALNPVYKVGDQIVEMIQVHRKVSKAQARRRAIEMLDLVGIPQADKRIDQYTHEFSGGMRQRAMIAMALSCDPQLIIADEPTTALDVTVQAQVLEVLVDLAERLNTAVVLITHDLGVVAGMADRVTVMYAGRMVESGSVDDVFDGTAHPYTAGLLSSLPRLDSDDDEPLMPIGGQPPSMLNPPPGCSFHPRCRWASEASGCMTVVPATLERNIGHVSACHRADELIATGEIAREDTGAPGDDTTGQAAARAAAAAVLAADLAAVDAGYRGPVDSTLPPGGDASVDPPIGGPVDSDATPSVPGVRHPGGGSPVDGDLVGTRPVTTSPVGVPPSGGPPPGGGPPTDGPPAGRARTERAIPSRPSEGPAEHPDGTTILVLGILGLVLCGLLAPVAWVKGNRAQSDVTTSPAGYTNAGLISTGRILGIIGTLVWVPAVIYIVFAVLTS